MLKQYNLLFWNEYIIKHHLSRFLGSVEINRGEPFYFYFVTLMWGFFPWVVSCLAVWISKLIKVLKFKNFTCNYENLSSVHRFLLYNSVIVVFILLFFSFSETKLITYILPIYGALSCLGGYVWWGYITHKKYEKLMNNSLVFLGITFILISIAALLTPLYLPKQLYSDIMSAKTFCILIFFATGLALILFTKRRLYINTFASLVLFMALCSAVATEKFFEIDYKFGQDDLIKFAQYAKENNYSLTTFSFGKKYSLLYYGEQPVVFGTQLKPKDLEKTLDKDNNLVIVKIKDLNRYKEKSFDIIETGRKYALIEEKGENYVSVNK